MKKILFILLAVLLVLITVSCRNNNAPDPEPPPEPEIEQYIPEPEPEPDPDPEEPRVLNVWAFTNEVPNMIDRFMELHPEIAERYILEVTDRWEGVYSVSLARALKTPEDSWGVPDIFAVESAFATRFTQGEYSQFAATYRDMGIDIDRLIPEARIAPYSVQIGTRPSDGEVVGLGFQGTGGAFIYRRSIAERVFGTDEPDEIAGIIGPGWPRFWQAAQQLAEAGHPIVSGDGDVWHSFNNAARSPWIDEDGYLYIDPSREAFLDVSRKLWENGWSNRTENWSDPWFADMRGEGATPAFGFFGPAWLANYVMAPNTDTDSTYGDWAVTRPPVGFFWGGTWILANANSPHLETIGRIIEWITLDTSTSGLQYLWATGTFNPDNPTKDAVTSAAVMERANGEIAFLGGQNMFDVFIEANEMARGDALTMHDEDINSIWRDAVRAYAAGTKTRDEAIEFFRTEAYQFLGIPSQ